ncbi:hypothetical protein CDL12_28477 [Handroanthus impetiginosus]|uniref:Uncharacterized protein n=1 Tax=Handroanthus impetiginosus TaxID=429701 RepID=A0A2G9G148_9LAMI|nr:hypothetical protein CDL12_28477 [Handroanthus impetiginosus]
MKSTLNHKEKHHYNFLKKDIIRFHLSPNKFSVFFYLTCLILTILLSFRLLYYPKTLNYTPNSNQYNQTKSFIQPQKGSENCDLFKGKWIRDERETLYTNYSCKLMPLLKNCFLHGRKDTDFLHWKWKPDQCELPRFRPETFFSIFRGKTMAFIGDSLARNQMESLLCLLTTVETAKSIEKDAEERFATWKFPKYNFTLMVFWSQFLVTATERVINGTTTGGFNLHLDKIDSRWSEKLPLMDYAIFSAANWFFRQNYLYEGGNVIGCVYCQVPNVTDFGPGLAIRRAFRAAFQAVNNCKNCRKIFALLRTYSPSHFENGIWNTGGGCNRTRPFGKEEVNRDGPNWEYRKIQVEEIEIARNSGEESGNIFEVLDVTEMMAMRPDGHPGVHWGNIWMKGYNDCIHWCLPGPIDVWNELLLEVTKRRIDLSLE